MIAAVLAIVFTIVASPQTAMSPATIKVRVTQEFEARELAVQVFCDGMEVDGSYRQDPRRTEWFEFKNLGPCDYIFQAALVDVDWKVHTTTTNVTVR